MAAAQMHLSPYIHLVIIDANADVLQYCRNYFAELTDMQLVWYNGEYFTYYNNNLFYFFHLFNLNGLQLRPT